MQKNQHFLNEIGLIDNFLTPEECVKIINYKDNKNIVSDFSKGKIGTEKINIKVRESNIGFIVSNYYTEWLYKKVYKLSQILSEDLDIELDYVEQLQLAEYSKDYQGYYHRHVDIGGVVNSRHRKISATIQLSDPNDYEGGELLIYSLHGSESMTAPKEIGSLTFFSSVVLHEVTKVTKGIRYSLVIWFSGPKFR
ncbi:2OG-Fe(II) oxygenase [bacterium]|nr:2OG-Fe(II) oxygenase [bacterium]